MPKLMPLLLTLILAAGALPASGSPVPPLKACRKPQPKMVYDSSVMQVSLKINLKNCRWWKGHFIGITGELRRTTVPPDGMGVDFACPQDGFGKGKPTRATTCKIVLELEHLPVEPAAMYEGYIEFPWKKGQERKTFRYLCTTIPAPNCSEG